MHAEFTLFCVFCDKTATFFIALKDNEAWSDPYPRALQGDRNLGFPDGWSWIQLGTIQTGTTQDWVDGKGHVCPACTQELVEQMRATQARAAQPLSVFERLAEIEPTDSSSP